MSIELPAGLWLRTKDVIGELNLSKATLFRRKKEGYFKKGTHFVTTGPTPRANVLWNVAACREELGRWDAPAAVKADE